MCDVSIKIRTPLHLHAGAMENTVANLVENTNNGPVAILSRTIGPDYTTRGRPSLHNIAIKIASHFNDGIKMESIICKAYFLHALKHK